MDNDLISRQAALDDAHKKIWYRMNQQGMREKIDEWIRGLPAAQPGHCGEATEMGDIISRQAAITAIADYERDSTAPIDYQKIIRKLPAAQSEQRWIPVTERLPDEDGDYLVTFESGYAEDYGFDLVGIAPFEVDCEGFGIWQEHFHPVSLGSLGSEWVEIHVTAWQKLPEPYTEE